MIVLGLHSGVMVTQHDAAAALIRDGKIIAVCEEERPMRSKGAFGHLPVRAVEFCLKQAGVAMTDVDLTVHTGSTHADLAERITGYLDHYFGFVPKLRLVHHQQGHLASAYYCSGFDDAMCISLDAYGDANSGGVAIGSGGLLQTIETFHKDHSLGMFYAAITSFLGFNPCEDEYKVMGLAAFGRPGVDLSRLAWPTQTGFRTNPLYWTGRVRQISRFEPCYANALCELLGPPRRLGESITQRHKDIACAAQDVLEQCVLSVVEHAHRLSGLHNLCMAGGVALNCSANLEVAQLPFLKGFFVQPAASDRGLALGCALMAAAEAGEPIGEPLEHVCYGAEYDEHAIRAVLDLNGVRYSRPGDIACDVAELLAKGQIVGWFQGRAEFGPRALGNRSILADPRREEMKARVNALVKFREEFRPFAPAVLEERASELFEMDRPSPFMTVAYRVRPGWRDRLGAVTHVNHTARVQTVNRDTAPGFHSVISAFERLTGVPAVLNTSFNLAGAPIVETPRNALATFAACGMHALAIGPYLVRKSDALYRRAHETAQPVTDLASFEAVAQ